MWLCLNKTLFIKTGSWAPCPSANTRQRRKYNFPDKIAYLISYSLPVAPNWALRKQKYSPWVTSWEQEGKEKQCWPAPTASQALYKLYFILFCTLQKVVSLLFQKAKLSLREITQLLSGRTPVSFFHALGNKMAWMRAPSPNRRLAWVVLTKCQWGQGTAILALSPTAK